MHPGLPAEQRAASEFGDAREDYDRRADAVLHHQEGGDYSAGGGGREPLPHDREGRGHLDEEWQGNRQEVCGLHGRRDDGHVRGAGALHLRGLHRGGEDADDIHGEHLWHRRHRREASARAQVAVQLPAGAHLEDASDAGQVRRVYFRGLQLHRALEVREGRGALRERQEVGVRVHRRMRRGQRAGGSRRLWRRGPAAGRAATPVWGRVPGHGCRRPARGSPSELLPRRGLRLLGAAIAQRSRPVDTKVSQLSW
mmetsp:Transcript_59808/g.151786  ORF Transcript_59808/g.151786 Transcript_59808/m.151786 type:complete len:254 (-) Transcript_59808:18-779(-)